MTGTGAATAQQRWVSRAGALLRVVAVAWAAWVLAGLVWLLGGHDGARLPPLPAAVARPAAPLADPARLAALNLFGQAPAAPVSEAAATAPDTSLQLRLAGVFVSADPARSSAIVAERNSQTGKVYRVNDSLPGGATLESVFEDRILIRRGAGSEILRFEKTGLLAGNAPAAAGGLPPATATGTPLDARALLGNALAAMSQSPDAFIQEMGLRRGGGAGYEVTEATPPEWRRQAGMQPGDRLLSVNGRRLGDPQMDRQTLEELQKAGSARVEVQRGGQIITIERKF